MEYDVLKPLQLFVFSMLVLLAAAFSYVIMLDLNVDWLKEEREILVSNSSYPSMKEDDFDKVVNGIHLHSGLIYADGFDIVRGTCTACHSSKLITQNRATREGWLQMIRWMQESQGLWDLGENETVILDYLAKNYAPVETGRRANLDIKEIKWFVLQLDEKDE